MGRTGETDIEKYIEQMRENTGGGAAMNMVKNIIKELDSARKEQEDIIKDTEKWGKQYSEIFNKSVNKGQLDILFKDIPEVATFNKTLADLDRQLAMFAIDQDEYNKKVNEAKGTLIAAADAANIGGSALEN